MSCGSDSITCFRDGILFSVFISLPVFKVLYGTVPVRDGTGTVPVWYGRYGTLGYVTVGTVRYVTVRYVTLSFQWRFTLHHVFIHEKNLLYSTLPVRYSRYSTLGYVTVGMVRYVRYGALR